VIYPNQAKSFVAGVNITDGTATKLRDKEGQEWVVNATMNLGHKLVLAKVEAGEPIMGVAYWNVVDTRIINHTEYCDWEVVG